MAVRRIRQKWYVDFRFQHADGRTERVRKRSPIQSKTGAEEFQRTLRTALLEPARALRKEVPKFSEYASEFMRTYAVANNKPSEQAAKASMLKHHLLPAFGKMRLDEIKAHPIETLKAELLSKGMSRKRVNNVLACLGKMLRYAHEIEQLESVPRIRLLKIAPQKFDFLTSDEYLRLIEATNADPERQALVLVGGDAGLRQGEMIALGMGRCGLGHWDADRAALSVARHRWRTEGWPGTEAPLTARLASALKAHRHLRSERVFCRTDGSPLTQSAIEAALRFSCKRGSGSLDRMCFGTASARTSPCAGRRRRPSKSSPDTRRSA